jgi:hypothetical protein
LQAIIEGPGIGFWFRLVTLMFAIHGLPAINALATWYIPSLPTIHSSLLWASQEMFDHYFLPFRAPVQFMLLLLCLVGLSVLSALLYFPLSIAMIDRAFLEARREVHWVDRIRGYAVGVILSMHFLWLAAYAILMLAFPFLLLLYHLFHTFGSLNAGTLSAAAQAIGREVS